MSQREDGLRCLACDFLLRNNEDISFSPESPIHDSNDLGGIWGPIKISIAQFEQALIHHRIGADRQARPECALFQLFLRAIELSFDRQISAEYLKNDAVVLSLLKTEDSFRAKNVLKTCKIQILDCEPPDRHRLAADFAPQLTEHSYCSVVQPDPSSPNTLRKIKQWIKKCEMECTHCSDNSAQSSTPYPTRLIDVGQPPLRLVLTENLKPEERLPYIALSHCWGTTKSFMTERDTIFQRLCGFAMADLPATFQDAVLLTRRLNIRYLWIDSLCIIQDDRQDWRIESSKMCDMYSNAYLTIAATLASDDGQGFLRYRKTNLCAIDLIYPNQETIRMFLQPDKSSNNYYTDSCDGPLHLRAWTLQERLLSRRILGFSSNQMYWECRGHQLQKESGYRSTAPGYLALLQPSLANEELTRLWHRLIEDYSERDLSDPRDKLIALEGLMERFATTSADTCVAGLWKRHLLDDLLWRPYPGGSYSRPLIYRAPSWSWASMDGPIWHHDREEWRNISHAAVEEINVDIARPETGLGSVTIQGSLLISISLPDESPQGSKVICATVALNPLLGSESSKTVPARSCVTIDLLLDAAEDFPIRADIDTGMIINIQMQLEDMQNNLAGFNKCRAVGLLLRRSGYRLNTPLQNMQCAANSSLETFGDFERIGVFESEWLDMWTLQQLCICTRRERIRIF